MALGVLLALVASLGFAALDGIRKHIVQTLSPTATAGITIGAQAVLLLGAAVISQRGIPPAPPAFYAVVVVTSAINLVTSLM